MKTIKILLAFLCISLLLFGAKKKRKKQMKPSIASIQGEFGLDKQFNKGQLSTENLDKVVITFDGTKQLIQAYAGCNRISGRFVLKNNEIHIGQLITTEMYCEGISNEVEAPMNHNLEIVNRYAWKSNKLELYENTELRMILIPKK